MAKPTLQASPQGIQLVKKALIERGLTQKMLADKLGIHRSVISALLNGKPILLENFRQIGADLGFEQDLYKITISEPMVNQDLTESSHKDEAEITSSYLVQKVHSQVRDINKRVSWSEAPSSDVFCGREAELCTLKQWIVEDNCRLVALLGMGGIGKTTLSVKLAYEIQNKFKYFIWRTLRNAPPVEEMLADLIRFLSDEEETDLPENVNDRITLLINYLQKHRSLLVLDNAETILQEGKRAGEYREGYEGYGELLRRVGAQPHISCLVLTSREKPKEFAPLEGEESPVRTISLLGLGQTEGQVILKDKGLTGLEQEWEQLVKKYSGNPLALKLVSEPIRELFGGKIGAFLDAGKIIFGDTRDLLDQQFKRASKLEKEIMYWLAIKREAVSLEDLLDSIVSDLQKRELLEALESLRQRSLIEKSAALFTLQPVVMEYMIDRLIEEVCQEITTGEILALFMSHTLIEATAKDYIRGIQIRLILKPIAQKLLNVFIIPKIIEEKLTEILSQLRNKSFVKPGYAGGNALNLLCHLKTNLSDYDFSHLAVWQAYLQDVNLHRVNFAYSDLRKSVFAETLGTISSVAFSPDGKFLATGDADNQIHLWQVSNEKSLFTCTGHTSRVRSVAFSPDSRILASASDDKTVKLWNVETGQCIKTLEGHTSWVWSVAFSPDSRILASASDDKTVKLWNVKTEQCIKTLEGHTHRVWSAAFSPNGHTLVSGSEDHTLKLWDVKTGQCLKTFEGHMSWVRTVAFNPNGDTLASGSDDQTVKLWDVKTG
ncbi:NB-ARC domain-containing protein, partial [Nostoc sp.]|uniref:WD40 domain-containing protein n=1 Tax=Nostoc sp. TaxID=1180 RepID=UPI002FFBFB3E